MVIGQSKKYVKQSHLNQVTQVVIEKCFTLMNAELIKLRISKLM